MRISTANAYDEGVNKLLRRQSELSESQVRLTSLKRVNKASDDPAAAARAERALASVLRTDTSQRAVEASRSVMMLTESALADAGELLQQAREGLVASGNGSYSDAERLGIAEKLSAIRQQLFAIANRSDGAGSYLFGGQGAARAPFLDQAGGVVFDATSGQVKTDPSTDLPLSLDGNAVWLSARTGNGVFMTSAGTNALSIPPDTSKNAWIDPGSVTDPNALTGLDYTVSFVDVAGVLNYQVTGGTTTVGPLPFVSGKSISADGMAFAITGKPVVGDEFLIKPSTTDLSVFDTIDKAILDLAKPMLPGAQRSQFNVENLASLDSVMANLQTARSVVGEVLTQADSETTRLGSQRLSAQTERSSAEDLDMVQAISDFQNRQTGYDAALKSYSMVQRMSLFQYING